MPKNSFLKTLWKRLVTLLYLLDKRPPSTFPLYLGVYVFHYTRSKLMARLIPLLKLAEKSIFLSARYTPNTMPYLL